MLALPALISLAIPLAGQTSPPPSIPKFEVASIKSCSATGGERISTPTRLDLPCLPVRFFIQLAYIMPDARQHGGTSTLRLEGGPDWLQSERYQIAAKPEKPTSESIMEGPMLQTLLEDRFHLKIHREVRDVPVSALVVGPRGLKLKLWDGTSCAPRDPAQPLPAEPGSKPWCGVARSRRSQNRIASDLPGAGMDQIAQILSSPDRPVVNRTGLTGKYDFHIEYAPEGADFSEDAAARSIFSALAQLGLKLESARAPRDFLVIDHIERPGEN